MGQPAFLALEKSGGLTPPTPRRGLWEREKGKRKNKEIIERIPSLFHST
jgi:hypothetical protein